uniref:RxLR effector candidate protein n=1 Tax=Peronospora matthiolae TaxID=2874970 RepID=A0AAV1TFM5_9STRA
MRLKSIILLATAAAAISGFASSFDPKEEVVNPPITETSSEEGHGVVNSPVNTSADAEERALQLGFHSGAYAWVDAAATTILRTVNEHVKSMLLINAKTLAEAVDQGTVEHYLLIHPERLKQTQMLLQASGKTKVAYAVALLWDVAQWSSTVQKRGMDKKTKLRSRTLMKHWGVSHAAKLRIVSSFEQEPLKVVKHLWKVMDFSGPYNLNLMHVMERHIQAFNKALKKDYILVNVLSDACGSDFKLAQLIATSKVAPDSDDGKLLNRLITSWLKTNDLTSKKKETRRLYVQLSRLYKFS